MDNSYEPRFSENDEFYIGVRRICLTLPGAVEVERWGHSLFTINTAIFAAFPGSTSFPHSVALAAGQDSIAIAKMDDRYFHSRHFDHRPWLGFDLLRRSVDWQEVAEIVHESYERTSKSGSINAG